MGRFSINTWLDRYFRKNRVKRTRRRKSEIPTASGLELLEQRALLSAVVADLDTGGVTAQDLAQSLVGPGVTISNVTYNGNLAAAGSFSNGFTDDLGIDNGVILSSGAVLDAPGPNDADQTSTEFGNAGDSDLTSLAGTNTFDAAVLEFDFIPTEDTLSFTYLFASEEYPDFAPPLSNGFNDVFAFYLDGVNVALLPNSSTPVSINTVNSVTNSQYFNDNVRATDGSSLFGTEYNGFTSAFTAVASVTPGVTAHIKLGVADAVDTRHDSTVFIQAGSFVAQPVVSITASDPDAAENPQDAGEYTFTRTGDTTDPLEIFFTESGSATTIADYVSLPSSVTIAAGDASVTLPLLAVNDAEVEPDETISLTLAADDAYAIDVGQNTGTVTIVSEDVDAPDVSFELASINVNEDAGTATVNLARTGDLSDISQVTVNLLPGGSATPGIDFDDASFPEFVTFNSGAAAASFTIDITNDNIDEPEETFSLELTPVSNAEALSPTITTVTIVDEDPLPEISIDDVNVDEDAGTAVFTVTLSHPSTAPIDVAYDSEITPGTAAPRADYTEVAGTLTFDPGNTSLTITVPILDDQMDEVDENYFIDLMNPVNATIADGQGEGTITDNDPMPSLSIGDVTVNESAGTADFIVTLTGLTTLDVSVGYDSSLFAGSATAGEDYTDVAGTLTFVPGETTMMISVPITNDLLDEDAETFCVDLILPLNASISDNFAEGTIVDDDPEPTVTIADSFANEADGTMLFTVTLSAPSGRDVTVDYDTRSLPGTALADIDYTAGGNTLTFTAGETTTTFTVPILEDTLDEQDETFFVDLMNPVNAVFGSPGTESAMGTITDNDVQPIISINDVTVDEREANAQFTVSLSQASGKPISIGYITAEGTATAGLDYSSINDVLAFSPGQTTMTLSVPIIDDTAFELTEDFLVNLVNPVNAVFGPSGPDIGTGTILNDDPAPELSIDDVTVDEGDGSAVFTVLLNFASGLPVTVDYTSSFAQGSATGGADYTDVSGTLTFDPGVTSLSIGVPILEDDVDESDEFFFVDLLNPTQATIAEVFGVGTITDNDPEPEISVDDVTVSEDDGLANFTVSLDAPSERTVMVDVTTSNVDAEDGLDYLGVSTTVTFDPGETMATVEVPIETDDIDELDETFTVDLSNAVNGTIFDPVSGTGTIQDSTPTPDVIITNFSGSSREGNNEEFTVSLTAPSSRDVVLTLGTTDGTAIAPGDYDGADQQLTIPAGQTEATERFIVAAIADGLFEGGEHSFEDYTVSVVSIDAGAVDDTSSTATGRIFDGDEVPIVSIQETPGSIVDEGDLATFDVVLSGPSYEDVTVTVQASDDTATAPGDYDITPVQVTIPAGRLSTSVQIQTNDDNVDEADTEVFNVNVSNIDAGIADFGGGAVGTINDNDDQPSISISDFTVREDDTVISFTATLSRASSLPVTFRLADSDGTALAANDYVDAMGTIVINAGQTETTISGLRVVDDDVFEPDEFFTLELSNASNATIATPSVTVTIVDDQLPPDVFLTPLENGPLEGQAARFDVELSHASSEDIVVTVGTIDGSAVSPDDYDGADQQITIPAGMTKAAQSVSFPTVADNLFEGTDEQFTVHIPSVDAGTAGDSSDMQTVTIIETDGPPRVSVQRVSGSDVNEGETATFNVILDRLSSEDITVTIQPTNGSAIGGIDFDASPISVTIDAGNNSAGFTVPTFTDGLDENTEFYNLRVDSINSGTATRGFGAEGYILDIDDAPSISVSDPTVSEADGTATFNVTLSAPSNLPVRVDYATADDSARDGLDYLGVGGVGGVAPGPETLTFNPGETNLEIIVPIFEDNIDEPDEMFFLNLSNASNATLAESSGIATILDNDDAPDVTIANLSGPVLEGELSIFQVSLTHPSSWDIYVRVGTTEGTAQDPADYSGRSILLQIPAGNLTPVVPVAVLTSSDGLFEGGTGTTEDFTFSVFGAEGGPVGDISDTATGVIEDVDSVPSIVVFNADSEATEGEAVPFGVGLNHPSYEDITVTVQLEDFSATAGLDYDGTPIAVTVPAGEIQSGFEVPTFDDNVDELGQEVFRAYISSVDSGAAIPGSSALGEIFDNDPAPTISVDDIGVSEGDGNATFTVSLSAPSALHVGFFYVTSDGDAEDGLDYSGVGGVAGFLQFAPGQTEIQIDVPLINDNVNEPEEYFTLDLSSPTNATFSNSIGRATITDDDPIPDVMISDATGNEGSTISFNISLSGPSSTDTTVTIGTTDGSAVSPDDYTGPQIALIMIPAGSTTATTTFDVDLLTDTETEGDENFTVSVINVDTGTVNFGDTGLGTITDVASTLIIDNGDPGYSTAGNWVGISGNNKGHLNDFEYSLAGDGNDTATWTFDLTEPGGPGVYDVSVSYRPLSNRASNAPYTVFDDGATALATVPVDQRVAADDVLDAGTWFESLGSYSIFGNTLVVQLTDQTDGLAIADAVRVQRTGDLVAAPDVHVEYGGLTIADDVGQLDFGDISLGANSSKTLTVSNSGNQDLTLSEPINVPVGFSLVSSFGSLVLTPGESTTFEIAVDTSSLGTMNGEVSFLSDDPDESPFNFQVSANVLSVAIIDDGDPGYSETGSWTPIAGNGKGFQNDFRFALPGNGESQASWAFDVSPGQYVVSASWRAHTNRATNATYQVSDNLSPLTSVSVNQRVAPGTMVENGTAYEELAILNVFGTTLTITLDNNADGLVIADAIRLDRIGDVQAAPEIMVQAGGIDIADGTGVFDFGQVPVASFAQQTFTVTNTGLTALTLDGTINLPIGFSLQSGFGSTTLQPAESTTFDVAVDTFFSTAYSGEVSFGNNDADESPFNFTIQAEVTSFTAIIDNSDGGPGYTTTGQWNTVNRNGFNGGFQYAAKGTGTSTAVWTFDLPTEGLYRVSVAYAAHHNRVTDAPFTVRDVNGTVGNVSVNQQLAPTDLFEGGRGFKDLGEFSIQGNQLVVELSNLSMDLDPGNILLIADAIRIERIGDLP